MLEVLLAAAGEVSGLLAPHSIAASGLQSPDHTSLGVPASLLQSQQRERGGGAEGWSDSSVAAWIALHLERLDGERR